MHILPHLACTKLSYIVVMTTTVIARILSQLSVISCQLEYILQVTPGSQVLLDNAERYGLYLAKSLNETISAKVLSRKNIGILCIVNIMKVLRSKALYFCLF